MQILLQILQQIPSIIDGDETCRSSRDDDDGSATRPLLAIARPDAARLARGGRGGTGGSFGPCALGDGFQCDAVVCAAGVDLELARF